ncbi:MAG: Unknown protein [uncultured Sulfurovum sp.]|uniref:Uncharacterized protein n=1 Tax=uncultured Sulfurovum sp. TaxID=269237 RepID=A0A6S6SPR1_9BACT|nr:MAG: Unknown protein [uncultured Sulfurovum sp.]
MAVDIKKLRTSTKSFTNIQTSIGDLYLFKVRVKEIIGIEKKLGRKLEELESKEFFKRYLPFFVHLKQDLVGEELERPEEYTLKSEDINKLSKDELEEIAKLFIEEHSSFYKEWKSSSKKEDATPVIYLKEEIDESLLRQDNESYIEYVYRLVLERHKKDHELARKMFSSFSSGLSSDILKTIGMGESLKSSFDSFRSIGEMATSFNSEAVSFENLDSTFPKFDYDFSKQIQDQEKRRLAPFKDLSSKIDLMIEAEKQTVSFMEEVYKTQVQIASELKTSSDSANQNSQKNLTFTKIIIILTVLSTLITAIAFTYSVWHDNGSDLLIKTNENIQFSIIETNSKLEKLTEVLIKQNKAQNEQIQILRREIKKKFIKADNNKKDRESND